MLVLAGSSGRLESERADLFARHGIRAHAIRWFGGYGQSSAPQNVPLELFEAELNLLRETCDQVAILGTSLGAEAALIVASATPVDAVIAIAPSSVVWPWTIDGHTSSHWAYRGEPLPWVPLATDWVAITDPPEFRSLYELSHAQHADSIAAATIPVERITGDVLLVAGGDDRVWPSTSFAADIIARRGDLATTLVTAPDAGHRIIFPGEPAGTGGMNMARGGTPEADAVLGARAWHAILATLSPR